MTIVHIYWAKLSNLKIIIPLMILCAVLLFYRLKRSYKIAKQLSTHPRTQIFLQHFSLPRLYCKAVLFLVGLLFLLITLLHPQWNKKEEVVKQKGRDLFIALDVSRSMLARDCDPNRLECAKKKIKALVQGLDSDRVGLLIFSGTAFIQCPLTADYGAFFMFLDQVDVETIASGTTALDQVILKVLEAYKQMESRKTKLLAIFTDGEDFSRQLKQVKKQANDQQLHIFTIGVGTTQGAPIPLMNTTGKIIGHIKDNQGSVVISHLNEELLYTVAKDSGGTYMHMTEDDSDIRSIISQVNTFEKEELGDRTFSNLQEQYPYFLFISFICFVMEWLV